MPTYYNKQAQRPLLLSLYRGSKNKCPACGEGRLFSKYLKVNKQCSHCHTEFHHHQADDAPPYFTIVILGHILVPLVIALEGAYRPPLWVHAALWLPITVIATLFCLQIVKGAIVSYQWALKMHGFEEEDA